MSHGCAELRKTKKREKETGAVLCWDDAAIGTLWNTHRAINFSCVFDRVSNFTNMSERDKCVCVCVCVPQNRLDRFTSLVMVSLWQKVCHCVSDTAWAEKSEINLGTRNKLRWNACDEHSERSEQNAPIQFDFISFYSSSLFLFSSSSSTFVLKSSWICRRNTSKLLLFSPFVVYMVDSLLSICSLQAKKTLCDKNIRDREKNGN